MTLLSLVRDACEECNIQRLSSVVGSAVPDARRMLRLANRVGRTLMRTYPWQELRGEQTFKAVAGETQSGALPADFDRFVPETFWDRSNTRLLSGPVSAVRWQGMKAQGHGGYPRFALRGGDVLVLPAMLGGEVLAYEYVSARWCEAADGSPRTAWAADDDVARLDEELITLGVIYEYRYARGMPWEKAAADYRDAFNDLTRNDEPGADVLMAGDIFGGGRHFGGAPPVSGDSF